MSKVGAGSLMVKKRVSQDTDLGSQGTEEHDTNGEMSSEEYKAAGRSGLGDALGYVLESEQVGRNHGACDAPDERARGEKRGSMLSGLPA
jgi:hypothetical protein